MARSNSSKRWLQEHFNDPYVIKAKKEGYRSRAAYKLLEIQEKDRIFKRGMKVIDLGAAPGGWTEVVAKLVGKEGLVIASDLLEMQPIAGVEIIQGDFNSAEVQAEILAKLGANKVDVVISDMAPNASGISTADQIRSICLAEQAMLFAQNNLKPEGYLLLKTFQGEGFDELLRNLRTKFTAVKVRKPNASRPRSKELYLLARLKAVV